MKPNLNINLINNIIDNHNIDKKIFYFGHDLAFMIGKEFYTVNAESLNILSNNIKSPFKIEFIGAKERQINYIVNYLKLKNDLIPFIKYLPNKNKFSVYNVAELVLINKEELIDYNKNILNINDKDRILSERKVKQLLKAKK